ncbi:MAG TPA: DUF1294 domain-containing protein [Candidatus Bathyarchaeota archaeon]|nr:DUF1294 domain-containing protein [Candidatus Bathyarchaeota archaeon]
MTQIPTLLIFLTILNIISLTSFGVDKLKSVTGGWRIPEQKLMLAALFGPFGAYAGMLIFRHKTRKTKFLLVPIFLLIQLGVIVYFRLI